MEPTAEPASILIIPLFDSITIALFDSGILVKKAEITPAGTAHDPSSSTFAGIVISKPRSRLVDFIMIEFLLMVPKYRQDKIGVFDCRFETLSAVDIADFIF